MHAGKIVGTAQMVRRMRTSQLKCTQTAAHHKCRIGQDFTFPRPRGGGWFKLGWAAGRKRVGGGTVELGEAPKTVSEEGN